MPHLLSHIGALKDIIVRCGAFFEGNCFYYHGTLNLHPDLYTKQLNLIWSGKQATSRICEIGFNAGHSTLLMLLGRYKTPLEYTVFDIGHHPYTQPCYEYIREQFPHVRFEYVEGDSTLTMPNWIDNHPTLTHQYDVVHVDGGHNEHCISNDMVNADRLVRPNGIVIVDDTNDVVINRYVDLYVSSGRYVELPILETHGYPHRIIRKL